MARSEVLVFLDAHCECNVGWLEPLLFSLSQNSQKVRALTTGPKTPEQRREKKHL